MPNYLTRDLNQKFELRSYKLYFGIKDSLIAEEILDSLDRATPGLKQIFGLTSEPAFEIYLYPDSASIERVLQQPLPMGETCHLVHEEGAYLASAQQMTRFPGEEVVRNFGYLLFNHEVKERETGIRQWRTPAWLREGLCLQIPSRVRPDSKEYLLTGWSMLQEAQKQDQLIRPSVLAKPLTVIPDANRRALAHHQAFYMVRLLMTNFSDKFFNKFATLMGAFEDMEAEAVFRQITTFDFEKFFLLFKDWVRTTNAYVAME